MDDPNRQALGLDPPWVEGTGGEAGDPQAAQAAADAPDDAPDGLDEMTKNELLAEAEARGLDVSSQMTKDELKDALR